MANPNLKAKIEAAKSALEEGKNNPSPNQERADSNWAKTFRKTTPDREQSSPSTADAPTNFELDAAKLDARITRLESKLAENRRDLYTLLGKIREITRLQNDASKNDGPRNTRPKDINSVVQNVNTQKSRKIAITLAALTGIIFGTSFFLASNFIDQYLMLLHNWAIPFFDFISDIVG